MIKAIHCNTTHSHVFTDIPDLDEISELLKDKVNMVWLDLQSPDEREMKLVAEEFKLHPLAIEDAQRQHQRPKVEEYDNFFFVVFYNASLGDKKQDLKINELDVFVGENFLVTVHNAPIKELDEAERRWRRNTTQMERGIGVLLYSILDTIVDNYFPVVDALVEESETLEDQVFEGKAGQSTFTSRLLELKKLFLQLRRLATPERDVLNVLTNRDSPIFSEHNLLYFRDVHDHLARVTDTLDLYRDQLTSTMDANIAVSSHELNKVMRTMTAASIILMSDALISGIYGMNFENMPELKWEYGYFGVLALMIGVSTALFIYFKRLNWF